MGRGISIFLGMNYSLAENLKYIQDAYDAGFRHISTSLHIPEANYTQIINEFKQVLDLSRQLEMRVIADISPNAYQYLDLDLHNLRSFVDFGFF